LVKVATGARIWRNLAELEAQAKAAKRGAWRRTDLRAEK